MFPSLSNSDICWWSTDIDSKDESGDVLCFLLSTVLIKENAKTNYELIFVAKA